MRYFGTPINNLTLTRKDKTTKLLPKESINPKFLIKALKKSRIELTTGDDVYFVDLPKGFTFSYLNGLDCRTFSLPFEVRVVIGKIDVKYFYMLE